MIPPTCRAVFIIHAKYLVHNIIVNATGIGNDSEQVKCKTTVPSCKTKYENVEVYIKHIYFCSFSVEYLVNIT